MCYSAQIRAEYQKFTRHFGAEIDLDEYVRLYWERAEGGNIKTPRALDLALREAPGEQGRRLRELIEQHDREQEMALEQELFRQRKRRADAERSLKTRVTKKAQEDLRISNANVARIKARLAALARTEPNGEDARIYPGMYAPVMIREGGRRVVRPMRYQCRPAGKSALFDRKYPGTYNARRDSLGGFWKDQFTHSHGVLVIGAFYENVRRPDPEAPLDGRGRNVVLEFRPDPPQDMLVACVWSRWRAPGETDLLSFAAITDDPPPEIAAAGHDRCIVPVRPERLDEWLEPDPAAPEAQYAILDDRERPYYRHRVAA